MGPEGVREGAAGEDAPGGLRTCSHMFRGEPLADRDEATKSVPLTGKGRQRSAHARP
jgi:hypothetical protein